MPWATNGFFKICWPRSLLKIGPKERASAAEAACFLDCLAVSFGIVDKEEKKMQQRRSHGTKCRLFPVGDQLLLHLSIDLKIPHCKLPLDHINNELDISLDTIGHL